MVQLRPAVQAAVQAEQVAPELRVVLVVLVDLGHRKLAEAREAVPEALAVVLEAQEAREVVPEALAAVLEALVADLEVPEAAREALVADLEVPEAAPEALVELGRRKLAEVLEVDQEALEALEVALEALEALEPEARAVR